MRPTPSGMKPSVANMTCVTMSVTSDNDVYRRFMTETIRRNHLQNSCANLILQNSSAKLFYKYHPQNSSTNIHPQSSPARPTCTTHLSATPICKTHRSVQSTFIHHASSPSSCCHNTPPHKPLRACSSMRSRSRSLFTQGD